MKKIILLIFLALYFNVSKSQEFKEIQFKFEITDHSEINELTKIVSIDKVIGNTVYAYSTDKELDRFIKLGYKYTIIENSKSAKSIMATTVAEMSNWDKYPTYDVYVQMMNDFATNYPNICKLINLGNSVNGRELLTVKISDNVNIEENEPEFFYTSTMHGNEVTGFVLMLRLIDSVLTNYNSEPEIQNLIDNIEIYINPLANPDGTYGSDNDIISYPTRSNANGIDLNRNFPCPTYGDYPHGEPRQPETVAMMEFAKENNITISGNFHGGIELANYPWDNNYRRHTDDDWFVRVSRNYATLCQNNSPNGYFDDENNGITHGADWYPAYGTRQDYMTYFENSREITFEISWDKFVSASELPNYWKYNRDALFQYMRECLYGIKGTVKNESNNPLNAMIWIKDHDEYADSSMVFSDPDVGDFHRLIEPGTYSVIASCKGYLNDTIENIVVSSEQATLIDFVLKVDNTTSINKKEIQNIKVYPNPFNESLIVDFYSESENTKISITNSAGQIVYDKNFTSNSMSGSTYILDNLGELNPGVYILEVKNGMKKSNIRISKF